MKRPRPCFPEKRSAGLFTAANGLMPVIGHEEWDAIALYEYPSISAFIEMNRDKAYQDIVHYRSDALEDSRLYCTVPE